MEFALSSDQALLRDGVRRALSQTPIVDAVRDLADQRISIDMRIWELVRSLGVPAVLIDPQHGGMGLSLLDAALIAEELGRHVAPVPFFGSTVLAPLALTLAGTRAQQEAWLPRLASGEALAGVAICQNLSGVRTRYGIRFERERLHGRAYFALDCESADLLIVADDINRLYIVRADESGLRRSRLSHIDVTRSLSELEFIGVRAEPLSNSTDALDRLRDAAWIMLAADTLGAASAMLERAVAYSSERKQFGRTIGTFQAVKHMCAEMAAELEPCRALVWYAAHAFDHLPHQRSLTAAHAKAHTSEVGRFVARTATEVHGGIGITDLLGLHFWFKRIGCNRQLFGGPERVRELAAQMQFDQAISGDSRE